MDDFELIYDENGEASHCVCKNCKQRVERGIVNISNHFVNCLQSGTVIIAKSDFERKVLDGMNVNIPKPKVIIITK